MGETNVGSNNTVMLRNARNSSAMLRSEPIILTAILPLGTERSLATLPSRTYTVSTSMAPNSRLVNIDYDNLALRDTFYTMENGVYKIKDPTGVANRGYIDLKTGQPYVEPCQPYSRNISEAIW